MPKGNTSHTIAILALLLCLLAPGFAAGGPAEVSDVGIDEKLGRQIPAEIILRNEAGEEVPFGSLLDRPTIVTLVYYDCRHICPILLHGVAEVLDKVELTPGKEFNLITVSFDESDTSEKAASVKHDYVTALKKEIPPQGWRFYTATPENIAALTNAVGFRYAKTARGFSHTSAMIVLSREGIITRYLYGVSFLPFDLQLAINEATEGKVGGASRKVLLYCFSYDPEAKRYSLNILRIVGTVTIVIMVTLFTWLVVSTKRYRKKMGEGTSDEH